MTSLKVKNSDPKTVVRGSVDIYGNCVCLYEKPADGPQRLVFAYALQPGEVVRQEGVDQYYVD